MGGMLLAIDNGAPSWEAARLVVHVAPRLMVTVKVLSLVVPGPRRKEAKDQQERESEAVRELVDDVVEELMGAGVEATGEVRSCRQGEVVPQILEAATRAGADLVVLGSRARSELTGLLFGSVSREVSRGAACPVVIVPSGAMTRVEPRRIVLAIDSRGDPERPLAATIRLARALDATVEVVCVSDTVRIHDESARPSSPITADEEALGKAVIALEEANVSVQARLIPDRQGLGPEVAREAIATGADLVVVGTRAVDWMGGDVAGAASVEVAHRTHRPVVVAPARRLRSKKAGS